MTRRPGYKLVWKSINKGLDLDMKIKINCVVMAGINDHELNDFVELTRDKNISITFIQIMPFISNDWKVTKMLSH